MRAFMSYDNAPTGLYPPASTPIEAVPPPGEFSGEIRMVTSETRIVAAYRRAIRRHRDRTGIRYPLAHMSVERDGSIVSINVWNSQPVARWSTDASGRVHIDLI